MSVIRRSTEQLSCHAWWTKNWVRDIFYFPLIASLSFLMRRNQNKKKQQPKRNRPLSYTTNGYTMKKSLVVTFSVQRAFSAFSNCDLNVNCTVDTLNVRRHDEWLRNCFSAKVQFSVCVYYYLLSLRYIIWFVSVCRWNIAFSFWPLKRHI